MAADCLGYKGNPALMREGGGALLQQFGAQELRGLGESLDHLGISVNYTEIII
jgi:hypothetical protein